MICYRGMTFCRYWMDCKNGDECSRAMTLRIEYKAAEVGLPVCRFLEKPDCFEGKAAEAAESEE